MNASDISDDYKSNVRTLEQMKADFESTLKYANTFPDTVFIRATASPDGPVSFNQRLASQRAYSTRKVILDLLPEFANTNIIIEHHVEDWDGLRQILLSDENFPQREQMLQILSDPNMQDNMHNALKDCAEGWEYFVNNHIYALRNSSVALRVITANPYDEFYRDGLNLLQQMAPIPSAVALQEPFAPLQYEPSPAEMEWKKMIFAARTNLLIPGMSVGLEFPIKDNWSIGIDYMFPWILPKSNEWCLETIGGFLEAKYWFPGKKYQWNRLERLQGHAIGVYGGLGYYDYQKKADGLQGEYIDVGVDYTFALPVAKGKLRMEFNIGLGFVRSWYRPYYMSSDYEDLIKEPGILYNTTNFFGPTRAGVSLVVPVIAKTRAPRNIRKGGE